MANDRFIELLTKKLSDEISSSESEEFKCLVDSDEACRQQYNFFKTYWVVHDEQYSNSDLMFQRVKSKIGVEEKDAEEDTETESPRKMFTFLRSVAAIFIAATGLALFWYFYGRNIKLTPTVNLSNTETPAGSKSKIVLSDGSIVLLNSETTLRYPDSFDGSPTREVYLNGEAFFEVIKDHQHPFIVHSGKMSIKVLGTSFNVKAYANEAVSETTLIKGAIEVTLADRPSDRIYLKPNEKLILGTPKGNKKARHTHLAAIIPDSAHSKYTLTNLTYFRPNDTTIVETSWTNNKLVFKDEAFVALANQMERWYGLKFTFKNDKLKDYPFTGIFDREDINQALRALELIEPFQYKIKNQIVYIY
jgi:ferric-dicitrate binding protein FerR (iron transport regulator)